MEKQLYEKYDGSSVTDDMLQEASQLFSAHYGIWAKKAAQAMGNFAKAGELALSLSLFQFILTAETARREPCTVEKGKASDGLSTKWRRMLLRASFC